MHLFAYSTLLVSMLLSLLLGATACMQRWQGKDNLLVWMERGHLLQSFLMTLGVVVLFTALAAHDFSYLYVAEYTDTHLPMFYTLTAFWAGQSGSLLFWAWAVALFGVAFQLTPTYKRLHGPTRQYYWMFFFFVMSFLLLLLSNWSNPFVELVPPPAQGNGLNPLLQHPGMIFHPPLLFLGYAGFTIPGCLALAQALSESANKESSWLDGTRNFTLLSWLFLTAGIILGAWWSYMELGWGGYWAWDPVENASLIPWFSASAFLHTAVLQRRRGIMKKANVFLMALTLMMSFFGTYLVRSGVVDSLHAFSSTGVGTPLLIFILFGVGISILVHFVGFENQPEGRTLSGIFSREGFLVITAWLLLILGAVILLGTMWPVFSKLWSSTPVGLDAGFYNRVCLPFFSLLAVMLLVCPWLEWKGGLRRKNVFFGLAGLFVGLLIVLYIVGMTMPVPLLAAAAAIACLAGIITIFTTEAPARKLRSVWGAYGVHFGLALMILGVAASGPYQQSIQVELNPGEKTELGSYTFVYEKMNEGRGANMAYVEAEIQVLKDGKPMGSMEPQRRQYVNNNQAFAEADVLEDHMGLGNELYATLMGSNKAGRVALELSVHPLVNWIWIGGTLMCLLPFVALRRSRASKAAGDV